jgi:hypothetical protein
MARDLTARHPADQGPARAAGPAACSGAWRAVCLRLRAVAHPLLAGAAAAPKAQDSAPAVEAERAAVRRPAGVALRAAAVERAPLEAVVASGEAAVPQPVAATVASDAGVGQPPAAVEVLDAAEVPQPAEVGERAAVAVRQPAEVAVLDAAGAEARASPAAFPASAEAARLSFPSLFLFPFPDLSAPGPAVCLVACLAHVRQSLRIALRTERSRQAARDEIWSW